MGRRYVNIREAARFTGFATATLYGWVSQRAIPHVKRGGRLRFDLDALQKWMRRGEREVQSSDDRRFGGK